MKQVVCFILLMSLAPFIRAGDVRTFQLEKEMPDTFLACLVEKDAVELLAAQTGSAAEADILLYTKVRRGKCGNVRAVVVYKKLIQEIDHEGEHYAVYLATIRGQPVFAITKGWRHESI